MPAPTAGPFRSSMPLPPAPLLTEIAPDADLPTPLHGLDLGTEMPPARMQGGNRAAHHSSGAVERGRPLFCWLFHCGGADVLPFASPASVRARSSRSTSCNAAPQRRR